MPPAARRWSAPSPPVGGKARFAAADLSEPAQLNDLAQKAPPADILVNNTTATSCTPSASAVHFGQTAKWDGDQLILISAFCDVGLLERQIGLA
jgi:hypothetical protein